MKRRSATNKQMSEIERRKVIDIVERQIAIVHALYVGIQRKPISPESGTARPQPQLLLMNQRSA